VVSNLLGNAIKFTDAGGVRVRVRGEVTEPDGRTWIVVSVDDDGVGIPEEALPCLFEPFFQVDSSHTRRHGGTGLGLAISRQIATLLGGSLDVASVLNEGSRFELKIPLESAGTAQLSSHARSTHASSQMRDLIVAGRRPFVLVVDDNPVNVKVATLFLRKLGCDSTSVEDGVAALKACGQREFDVVLLDRQMPGLDGCDVARELRRRGYSKPVVALTASAMARDRDMCLAAGMDHFLSKPLSLHALHAVLESCMNGAAIEARSE
jgi:CheY-like chemotaxis protein